MRAWKKLTRSTAVRSPGKAKIRSAGCVRRMSCRQAKGSNIREASCEAGSGGKTLVTLDSRLRQAGPAPQARAALRQHPRPIPLVWRISDRQRVFERLFQG